MEIDREVLETRFVDIVSRVKYHEQGPTLTSSQTQLPHCLLSIMKIKERKESLEFIIPPKFGRGLFFAGLKRE